MLRIASIALVAFSVSVLPASAATVTLQQNMSESGRPFVNVKVEAAPGETNDLRVEGIDDLSFRVLDSGAPLVAGEGCTADADGSLRCTARHPVHSLFVDAGDGDDRVASTTGFDSVSLSGGPGRDELSPGGAARAYVGLSGGGGDDTLQGGPSDDALDGGGGDDTLRGGPSDDGLDGGGGRDVLLGDGGSDSLDDGDTGFMIESDIGPDVLDGGPGPYDYVSYSYRTAFVTVDVTGARPSGESGEGDRITGVETVFSGSAGSLMLGGPGPERLEGGSGDDTIAGRGGRDYISGYIGSDRLVGGGGADIIVAMERGYGPEPGRDQVRCGSGRDRAVGTSVLDLLARDCETGGTAGFDEEPFAFPVQPVAVRRRGLAFKLPCPAFVRDACFGRMLLSDRRSHPLGSRRYMLPQSRDGVVTVPLSARARRRLKLGGNILRVEPGYGRYVPCSDCRRLGWSIKLEPLPR